jgi:hypothetical protein
MDVMWAADSPLAFTIHIKKGLGLVMKDIATKVANNTTQRRNGAPESTGLLRSAGFLRWPPPPAIKAGQESGLCDGANQMGSTRRRERTTTAVLRTEA